MPPKKKGGKKKGKKLEFLTDDASLAPYAVSVRDIIQTPLGVEATVLGVNKSDNQLWLLWPGNISSPLPSKAKSKEEMETFGYQRKPQWSHIQRSIDERMMGYFNQRYYGAAAPKSAAIKLPWPEGTGAWAAFQPSEQLRPKTAPV